MPGLSWMTVFMRALVLGGSLDSSTRVAQVL